MGSAVKMRTDYSAAELRRLAKEAKNVNQSRRLLSLAAVLDGMNRADAARVGCMDRQTLRDWVHRFNEAGPEGLKDAWCGGPEPRLSPEQKAELSAIVEAGPAPEIDGVVRWRRLDLKRVSGVVMPGASLVQSIPASNSALRNMNSTQVTRPSMTQ